jgi:hypothetical protein
MDMALIEAKIAEIVSHLESEVMEVLQDESLGKGETNLKLKPLASTKQILMNAIESIEMVNRLAKEEQEGGR